MLLAATAGAQTPQEQSLDRQKAAIERQRESVKQQVHNATETGGFFTTPWQSAPALLAAPLPVCDPVNQDHLDPIILQAARRNALTPDLLRAVIRQESANRPCAVSRSGAMGLMQIMPETAQYLGLLEPFDPVQNIDAGSRYLKELVLRYGGDLFLALAAYNAGPGAVDAAGGIPAFAETQNYVRSVSTALSGSQD